MSNLFNIDLNGRVSKEDLPLLIGKSGRNMKTCIKNMWEKGCTSPNFKFVEEEGTDVISVSLNYSTQEQLELMKTEVELYLSYWESNKDNFRPQSSSRGPAMSRDAPRERSFHNNMLLNLGVQDVSSFIGEGGSNIKSLLDKINTDLSLDNKVQLRVIVEEDIVYMHVTLHPPHAFMRDYITVENIVMDFVKNFNS
jgi:hypothetical protein